MDSQEAMELIEKVSDGLKDGSITNETLPTNYFEALDVMQADMERADPNHNDGCWESIWDMLQDIKLHVQKNGGHIVGADNVIYAKLGFRCTATEKTWHLASDKMNTINDRPEGVILIRALQTVEGKLNLIAALNGQ